MTREELSSVLSYVRCDSVALSHALFEKYGIAENILSRDFEELSVGEGTPETAIFLKLLLALTKRSITDEYKTGRIYTEKEIEKYLFALFFGESEEKIFALLFDNDGRFLGAHALSNGAINSISLAPRRIVTLTERIGASHVILAHNHPMASPEPSQQDAEATEYLSGVLSGFGIRLVSHYTVSGYEIRKIQLRI